VPKAPGSNHTNMADGKLFSSSSVWLTARNKSWRAVHTEGTAL
jgi:hypothetical protein